MIIMISNSLINHCFIVNNFQTTITYGSSFALIALSIDRAEAVCRPLRATSSKFSKSKYFTYLFFKPAFLFLYCYFEETHALMLIGSAWLAAVVCGIPTALLAQKVYEGTQYENCRFDFSRISPQAYLTSIAMSVFVIPAFIIATCHIIIVIKIWSASKSRKFRINDLPDLRQKRSQEKHLSNPLSVTTISISNKKLSELSLDKKSLRIGLSRRINRKHVHSSCISRAKVKTVKMTCLIVSTYVICWCPFMVWNLMVTYGYMRRYAPYLMKYSPIIQCDRCNEILN
ncbi:neuropeptide S receptor 1 [Schistosoma bovis]|uniref:Neuropeptide S receptor 1 n=1 Tax=Schistosoma bovis TaxID=6184 RepID=A0A430QCF8_SCHBO|nr:neuropeptide S receptor 1 [Schistosoma bovis]